MEEAQYRKLDRDREMVLEMSFIFIWIVITCTYTTYFKLYIPDLCTLHVTPQKF